MIWNRANYRKKSSSLMASLVPLRLLSSNNHSSMSTAAENHDNNTTTSEVRSPLISKNSNEEDSDDVGTRTVSPDDMVKPKYPANAISNAKYTPLTFVPIILYQQFKFFFNLYFLLVALSQAVPILRVGYLSSYVVPLVFVLVVTMSKEAMDDIARRKRDGEANREAYEVLFPDRMVQSQHLTVGDLVVLHKNQRVPADLVLVKSSEKTGECFIRTDQLDGETDWKLRNAPSLSQDLSNVELPSCIIKAARPSKDIHTFLGTLTVEPSSCPLNVDNTLWANTVIASGSVVGCVIYTGTETRQAMNTSSAGTKVGLFEIEINKLSKILCLCVFLLSIILVVAHGWDKYWYVSVMKFLILFSSIIPVSLRVNLDLGKSVYAYQIEHDKTIPDTVVRTSTIPEDLGRIEYLLTDKTGTLTQNDMVLKKIHVGSVSYAGDAMDYVSSLVRGDVSMPRTTRRDMGAKVKDLVFALALCHNVTPSYEDGELTYQASSPDEIAIVEWTNSVGLSLVKRDRSSIVLRLDNGSGQELTYDILQMFPFTSESKRMGIVVRDREREEIMFLEKGADTIMGRIVQRNDWLEEETGNMAREGLRTLVVGRKRLSDQMYDTFSTKYQEAALKMTNRDSAMATVVRDYLEHDLELLGLTGVEDKLQKDVKPSLEILRNAGIKIWMITGDKVETARCVGISSKLVARGQYIHVVAKVTQRAAAYSQLEYVKARPDCCLLIDGESLALMLDHYREEFIAAAVLLPTVIACRCSPTQKAELAKEIKSYTGKRVCCIGDGGNDVSMIQAANVGVGIVGKEGRQASLAADFSITQFCFLTKLLLWHGRNSYKRSAKMSQFVIHRGLIISICQAVYSIFSAFEPLALYQGWLMVGYATLYTMAPVFSLVLDRDVDENLALLYPELYKELTEGKSLSFRSFFIWVLISVYQGGIVQGLAQVLVGLDTSVFTKLVAVSFTSLILVELINVALEIITWCKTMIMTEVITAAIYFISIPFLGEYFDLRYVITGTFVWKTVLITATALIPPWIAKTLRRKLKPPSYAKVQQG